MSKYEKKLKERIKPYFNIKENYKIDNFKFDFYARYHQKNSKYFLMKKFKYCTFDNNEYIFYKNGFEESYVKDIDNLLKRNVRKIVDIDKDHMSSVITFVFYTDNFENNKIIKKIKKYKFYKSFKFGFNGWVNVRLILINSNGKQGFANKFGKKELDKYLIN
ncbi:MAG: hypothetical protein ACQEQE_07665 [Bacillota bacterium]